MLRAQAQQLIDQHQPVLPFDGHRAGTGSAQSPLPVVGERAGYLIDAFEAIYQALGFDTVTGGDEVFKHLVLARIVKPGSNLDSIETLAEVGVGSASYATIKRRLPRYAQDSFQDELTRACATHAGIGPGVLILFDVTTLYLETDEGDGFREPGFSGSSDLSVG